MAFGAFRRSMRARSFPFLFLPLRLSGGGGQTASASSRIRPYSASNLCLSGDRVLAPCHRPPLRPLHVHQGGLEARRPSMAGAELLDARQLPEQVRAADGMPGQFVFPVWPPAVVHCHAVGQHSVLPHALLAPPGADRLAGELLCGRAVPQAVFPFTSVPVSSKWTTPSFASMAFVAARVPPTLEAHREAMAEMVPVESPTPIRLPGSVWMRPALTAP